MGVQQNYKKTPNLPNPLVLWEGNQDEREETGPGPHGKAVAGWSSTKVAKCSFPASVSHMVWAVVTCDAIMGGGGREK